MSIAATRGRPKAPERMVQINIYASPELAAWLDAEAQRHGRTRSNMAATLLEQARRSTPKRSARP